MERVRRQLIVCPGTGTHRNASGALRGNDVTNTLSLDLVAHKQRTTLQHRKTTAARG